MASHDVPLAILQNKIKMATTADYADDAQSARHELAKVLKNRKYMKGSVLQSPLNVEV